MSTIKHNNHLLIVIALILVGLNLRPSMAAIGPLLPFIQQDIALSYTQTSLLTMLPVMTMGLMMFISAYLIRRFDTYKLVALSLAVVGVSSLSRFFIVDSGIALIMSAVIAGCGIAIIQAVLPTIIKKNFPYAIALYMGMYVTAIMGGAAIAASLVATLQTYSNSWQVAISIWSILAVFALAAWFVIQPQISSLVTQTKSASLKLYKIPRAWLLGIFFGVGTASYTCALAWLPPYYLDLGWSSAQAGLLLALLTGAEVVAGLVFPALANRSQDRRKVLYTAVTIAIMGYLGLIFSPESVTWLWIGMLGLGVGGLFPMSLIITMDHYADAGQAGELISFVQGVGYMIAALSPLFAGIVKDLTGSFQLSWMVLFGLTCALFIVIPRFNPQHYDEKMQS